MFCRMLDCEHNRKFLASMFGYKFWEIEDQEVLNDVQLRAEAITKNAVILKPLAPKETKMSDAEIETEMARLQAEAAKRKIAKSEAGKRKPIPETLPPINNKEPEFDGTEAAESTPEISDTNPLPVETASENPDPVAPASRGKPGKRRKSNLVSIGG